MSACNVIRICLGFFPCVNPFLPASRGFFDADRYYEVGLKEESLKELLSLLKCNFFFPLEKHIFLTFSFLSFLPVLVSLKNQTSATRLLDICSQFCHRHVCIMLSLCPLLQLSSLVILSAESIEAVWIPTERLAGPNVKCKEVKARPPENWFPVKSCLVLAGLIAKTKELEDATASWTSVQSSRWCTQVTVPYVIWARNLENYVSFCFLKTESCSRDSVYAA